MMLLAVAGNMGGQGASGLAALEGEQAAKFARLLAKAERLIRHVSAALPTPNPAWRKKCRRLTVRRRSCASVRSKSFIVHSFVMVSSIFSRTLATSVHAAWSATFDDGFSKFLTTSLAAFGSLSKWACCGRE